jgi:hypothetical protein
MRAKPILVTVAAVLAVVGVAFLAYRWEAPLQPALCQVCSRPIPQQTAYRMETARGVIHACCPRCAMHAMIDHPGTVRRAWATDFDSRRLIPAETAYYDEGGDAQYCTVGHEPVERGPEGVRVRVYDRCLPTLVAFATRDEAETYRQQHGGRVLTYAEAVESVRSQ